MVERTGIVTMKGKPLTLIGSEPKVNAQAPDAILTENDLNSVKLSTFFGKKVTLILAVPSLDTPVCSTETRRFNEEVGKFKDTLQCITISMDLPFAQKRWCGAEGIKNVLTLSDYQETSFGKAYGVLIKEFKLLARAVFLVDQNGVLRFSQIIQDITHEPKYEEIFKEAQSYLAKK